METIKQTPSVLPFEPDKLKAAEDWFQLLDHHALLEHMQRQTMQFYAVFIQQSDNQCWLIEYRETEKSFTELMASFNEDTYSYNTVASHYWKECIGLNHHDIIGIRQVIKHPHIFSDNETVLNPNEIHSAFVTIIPHEQHGKLFNTLDQIKDTEEELNPWLTQLNIKRWSAWLQECPDYYLLIQYFMSDKTLVDILAAMNHEQATCQAIIDTFYRDLLSIDLADPNTWPNSQLHFQRSLSAQQKLYPSEIEVLYWAARGLSAKETAKKLQLSPNTITSYRQAAIQKLGASNITHAIHIAHEMNLFYNENK